jgi:hypothetical protein
VLLMCSSGADSSDRSVSPNGRDPKVRTAVTALDALDAWLKKSPDEFLEWYDDETEGESPEMKLRTFWERHFT